MVLTGAGVSAESGVPTFRAAGGLWESYPVEKVASPEGFREDPELVWRFYSERRRKAKTCEPNAGHHAPASSPVVPGVVGQIAAVMGHDWPGLH